MSRNIDRVRLLLENGADVHAQDQEDRNVLWYANEEELAMMMDGTLSRWERQQPTIDLLREAGATE